MGKVYREAGRTATSGMGKNPSILFIQIHRLWFVIDAPPINIAARIF